MIFARVQGHPSRAALQDRLVRLLEPLPTEVFVHESSPPDPWANYRRCLTDIPDGVSHLLVVQDDAIPCPGFSDAVGRIAARWQDHPTCLFLGSLPSATAAMARRAKPEVRYVPLTVGSFMPLVAVLWPSHVARSFLSWSETARGMTRADDGNAARWVRTTRQQVMVTVPSLVQHDDGQPSVKGGRDHAPWQEKWRQALLLASDCSAYEW